MGLFKWLFGESLDELAEKEIALKSKSKTTEVVAVNTAIPKQEVKSLPQTTIQSFEQLRALKHYEKFNKMIIKERIDNYRIKYKYDVDIFIPDFSLITEDMLFSKVNIAHEPDNEHDKNALSITCNNIKIGYIYKGRIQDMIHDWHKRNEPMDASVYDIDFENSKAKLYICFYKNPLDRIKDAESLITKLTACNNCECQDNLSFREVNDEVLLEYDYEKETYIVTDDMGYPLGSISKSISQKINNKSDGYDLLSFINSIEQNFETDKYVADIIVYFV